MSQQINLFNPVFLKQKKYFSALAMMQALGLILFGTILLAAYAGYQVSDLSKRVVATNAQLGLAQAQLTKVNTELGPQQKSKVLEEEIQKTEAEVKSLNQVFNILQKGEFGNTKGYSEYLRAFSRQVVGGLWLTGFTIHGAGNEIGIQGRVLQPELVPEYIKRLKDEPIMQGKSFATLEMQVPQDSQEKKGEPAKYIEFSLQSSGAGEAAESSGARTQ